MRRDFGHVEVRQRRLLFPQVEHIESAIRALDVDVDVRRFGRENVRQENLDLRQVRPTAGTQL